MRVNAWIVGTAALLSLTACGGADKGGNSVQMKDMEVVDGTATDAMTDLDGVQSEGTAIAAPGTSELLMRLFEIHQQFPRICILDHSSRRKAYNQIFSAFPGHLLAPARLSMFRLIYLLIPQVYQGGKIGVGLQHHISALATISTIRPPQGNILFPAETATAVSTIPRLHGYGHLINKHGRKPS